MLSIKRVRLLLMGTLLYWSVDANASKPKWGLDVRGGLYTHEAIDDEAGLEYFGGLGVGFFVVPKLRLGGGVDFVKAKHRSIDFTLFYFAVELNYFPFSNTGSGLTLALKIGGVVVSGSTSTSTATGSGFSSEGGLGYLFNPIDNFSFGPSLNFGGHNFRRYFTKAMIIFSLSFF